MRLFNVVMERKGAAHPIHDIINRSGIGMRVEQCPPERELWMDDATWNEAKSLHHWRVTIYQTAQGKVDERMTLRMQFGTYRVWKVGAAKAAPPDLAEHVADGESVKVTVSSAEHRQFVAEWSAAEPPCIEEVVETLIHDALNVERNLTRRDFRRRFAGQTPDTCDHAWAECVRCRRSLKRLFKPSDYHTLLAWSYRSEGQ